MKRLFLGFSTIGAATLLCGCPIYSGICGGSGPDTSSSGACVDGQCQQDSDCNVGDVCSSQGTCTPAAPLRPDAGGCSDNSCPDGYVCKLSNGLAQCVVLGSGGDAGAEGSATGYAGDSATSGDASDGSIASEACNADAECGGHGGKCVDGTCTSQVGLCSDGTQCRASGSSCVDGICEAICSSTAPCPSGYGCDFTRGICNLDPGACSGSGASSCLGGATCVEGHCVPPCDSLGEAAPECATGQVCVNGGCIPDQAATFACANDGDEGQLANTCAAEFICLHHDCYASCVLDGGTGCDSMSAGSNSVCKDVTTETGTYAVCAAAGTLGSDCDPAQGRYCATGVCINGSCD